MTQKGIKAPFFCSVCKKPNSFGNIETVPVGSLGRGAGNSLCLGIDLLATGMKLQGATGLLLTAEHQECKEPH